jgi:hypothetical protein
LPDESLYSFGAYGTFTPTISVPEDLIFEGTSAASELETLGELAAELPAEVVADPVEPLDSLLLEQPVRTIAPAAAVATRLA